MPFEAELRKDKPRSERAENGRYGKDIEKGNGAAPLFRQLVIAEEPQVGKVESEQAEEDDDLRPLRWITQKGANILIDNGGNIGWHRVADTGQDGKKDRPSLPTASRAGTLPGRIEDMSAQQLRQDAANGCRACQEGKVEEPAGILAASQGHDAFGHPEAGG